MIQNHHHCMPLKKLGWGCGFCGGKKKQLGKEREDVLLF